MCIIFEIDTHWSRSMRTNIDIDEDLMVRAMKATGQKTKKATVEAALRKAVMLSAQREALDELWGTGWEGDLDEMRRDWSEEVDWGVRPEK
jgi:Arc/MetJ family transcription regulator